jgi:carboxypeptidase C (cathepsin A)
MYSANTAIASMSGLFQQNGPCKFELGAHNTKPVNNTLSWNNNVNMLYLDPPMGVGFSYGNTSTSTNATSSNDDTSLYVWKFMQAFHASFPEYKSRHLGIFTQSYGSHFGAQLSKYIHAQNKAKAGEEIKLVALGISNGWHDALIQEPSHADFALSNSYQSLITEAQFQEHHQRFENYCLPELLQCNETKSNRHCALAHWGCLNDFENPLYSTIKANLHHDINKYDIRKLHGEDERHSKFLKYMRDEQVMRVIGANNSYTANRLYTECSGEVFDRFESTGEGE